MTADPKPLTDEEQRVHDAACRCREVETNAANGDVCWISRVYEWPKPRPASTWNHDLRIVAADWWNQRATIDALRAENARLKECRKLTRVALDSVPVMNSLRTHRNQYFQIQGAYDGAMGDECKELCRQQFNAIDSLIRELEKQ